MSFIFEPLRIREVVAVRPHRHLDDRGYFQEMYRESSFNENGIDAVFVQTNVTRSHRWVLRGLHYQLPPQAQAHGSPRARHQSHGQLGELEERVLGCHHPPREGRQLGARQFCGFIEFGSFAYHRHVPVWLPT